jgi:hypothetical protein
VFCSPKEHEGECLSGCPRKLETLDVVRNLKSVFCCHLPEVLAGLIRGGGVSLVSAQVSQTSTQYDVANQYANNSD